MKTSSLRRVSTDPKKKAVIALDRVFSKMIHARDDGKPCIACSKFHATYEAGHFRPRESMGTRFDPRNVNLEGYGCNRSHVTKYGIKDMELYRANVDERWGRGTADRLYIRSKQIKQWSIEELNQLSDACRKGYPVFCQIYNEYMPIK